MKIHVLIADDHALMREGLRTLIERRPDMSVVGEAGNGIEALSMAAHLSPHVAVMDVAMPDMNGIEATRRMAKAHPATKIIALSVHTDRRFVLEMLKAGAFGYLPKDCAFDELAMAVRSVAAGKIYISPEVAGDVMQEFLSPGAHLPKTPVECLSEREREVFQRLAEGQTIKEAAFEMGISPKTVETFRRRLMEKLDVRSVADLTKYAIREGITALE